MKSTLPRLAFSDLFGGGRRRTTMTKRIVTPRTPRFYYTIDGNVTASPLPSSPAQLYKTEKHALRAALDFYFSEYPDDAEKEFVRLTRDGAYLVDTCDAENEKGVFYDWDDLEGEYGYMVYEVTPEMFRSEYR